MQRQSIEINIPRLSMTLTKQFRLCGLILVTSLWIARPACSADPAGISQAIGRGAQYLRANVDGAPAGDRSLMALALLKAGDDPQSPGISATVASILKKINSDGKYVPGGHHLYEAAVDANLLVDVGGDEYTPQVQAMVNYILEHRRPDGGWDYPPPETRVNNGDTSVVQYCCLGLWAAARIGIKIDPQVWADVLTWHIKFHEADGGYAYTPGVAYGDGEGASTLNMTGAALGSIHIALMQLQPGAELFLTKGVAKEKVEPANTPAGPKFGVLESLDVAEQPKAAPKNVRIPAGTYEVGERAFNWFKVRYRVTNDPALNAMYYYYTLERMASFANVSLIGDHDWYLECADYLIQKQGTDGTFVINNVRTPQVETSFGVLFLTRSTGKLLKRRLSEPGYGDGLLAGGRGLPDDLSDVDFNGRQFKGKQQPNSPLDQLLASLQNPGEISLDTLQDQIVEQVQLGDRQTLIGQKDLLIKLVTHPDASIRQTAIWALGRTDDLRMARYLLDALSDVDPNVMMEAQNALCWIARRPRGIGLPENPVDAAPEGATPEQKQAAILAWRNQALKTWGEWYLENRPYADRADEFESHLRTQLDRLRQGLEP